LEIYGVKNIVGIPFGYCGFFEKGLKEIPVRMLSIFSQALKGLIFITSLDHCGDNLQLSRAVVENINLNGGSFLGVSRGGAQTCDVVDSIQVSNLKWKT
jgi:6-phosphofructokinase 1